MVKSGYKGANRPVEQVSWYDCHDFLDALNSLGLGTFSLPSEAQWEYACRAGTTTEYFWGDNFEVVWDYDDGVWFFAWYHENSGGGTHDVGGRLSNQWGLYDMAGNVGEWCEDAYNRSKRVLRGGSWAEDAVSSADRLWHAPTYRLWLIGFRVVRTP